MANHGFGHIDTLVTIEQIDKDFDTINHEHFKGIFDIVRHDNEWTFSIKNMNNFSFRIWKDQILIQMKYSLMRK